MIKGLNSILSMRDKNLILSELKDKGKKVPKNWTSVHSEVCLDGEFDKDLKPLIVSLNKKHGFNKDKFAIDIVSNPNAESSLDFGEFRVRYSYGIATNHAGEPLIKDNTREFCAALVRARKIYRREDISIMSFRGSNPTAKRNYSIFNLKGHWNCRHAWIREVFIVERDPVETENNPIVEKTTLMNEKLKKAIAAFKEANGGKKLTKDEIVAVTKALLSEQKFMDIKVDDKILRIDADSLEEGASVSWIDESGEVSEVPNGELTLEEEDKIVTITDGKISSIEDIQPEEDTSEEEATLSTEAVEKVVSEKLKEALKPINDSIKEFKAKFEDIPAVSKKKTKASFKSDDDKEDVPIRKRRRKGVNSEFSIPGKSEE